MTYRNDTGDESEYAVMNPIEPSTIKSVVEDESEYVVMKDQLWTR